MTSLVDKILERIKNSENEQDSLRKTVYKYLSYFIIFLGLFIAFSILFPTAAAFIVNTIWVILFSIVVIFITLGILVIVGMRQEVAKVLDVLLEGSLTVLDAIELLKTLWKQFKELVKEFVVNAAPFFAYALDLVIYIALLVLYKTVGQSYDVTALTITLTFLMIFAIGVLNRPKEGPQLIKMEWLRDAAARFHRGFVDGLEVVIFLFFLTMDSTRLFFLPENLNIPVHAQIAQYDLMVTGIRLNDHTKITITLIIATIILEIIRNIMKLIAVAWKYYEKGEEQTTGRLKDAIRRSFIEFRDDITRFITFTTILLLVFLLLPRLKLLTLVVASITNLVLDLTLRKRLTFTGKGEDLISRLLAKLFKL